MLKPMTGRVLNEQFVFDLDWDDTAECFMLSGHHGEVRQPLTPDELAELGRELLRAAVTKGED